MTNSNVPRIMNAVSLFALFPFGIASDRFIGQPGIALRLRVVRNMHLSRPMRRPNAEESDGGASHASQGAPTLTTANGEEWPEERRCLSNCRPSFSEQDKAAGAVFRRRRLGGKKDGERRFISLEVSTTMTPRAH